MLTKTILAFCLLGAFVLAGCSKTETMNGNSTTSNSNKAGTTTAASTSTASSAGDKIGVPECDDFIARYEACVAGKVPEMARSQFATVTKTWRDSWRKAASTPEGKAGLAAACKKAAEDQRAAMKPYGCDF
jgi:hypothetical protein